MCPLACVFQYKEWWDEKGCIPTVLPLISLSCLITNMKARCILADQKGFLWITVKAWLQVCPLFTLQWKVQNVWYEGRFKHSSNLKCLANHYGSLAPDQWILKTGYRKRRKWLQATSSPTEFLWLLRKLPHKLSIHTKFCFFRAHSSPVR